MSDLWTVLGYDALAAEIGRTLHEADGVTVIEGPPGVGKSLLAKGIGELWKEGGGSVAVAEGDSLRSDVALYPLNFGLGPGWKSLGSAAAGVATAAETLVGTAGIITATVQALAAAIPPARKKRMLLLSDAEQGVLVELQRLGRRPPLLLIADNLHWWDARSLELLGRLRNPRMQEAFPFLVEMRILAVQTPEPYQSVVNPTAHEEFLAPMETHPVRLPRISREGFDEVLTALGAPADLTPDQTDQIYSFSDGNLALVRRCAVRLARGEEVELEGDFVRRLMGERVRTLGAMGKQAVSLLEVAAIVGLRFRRNELVCASGADQGDAARLLRYCREENMVELEDETGRFVHDAYRTHFLTSGGTDRIAVHERLSDCFREMRPGDYDLRCANALDAEKVGEAGTLGVQAALQTEREGRSWRDLPPRIVSAIESAGMGGAVSRLIAAQGALKEYRLDDCLADLDSLPADLPKALQAESTYLRALCLMATRSENDRETGRRILAAWSDYAGVEAELGSRLALLLLYGLMHLVDKAPGLELEESVRRELVDRVNLDAAAKDTLHTLDRCCGGLYPADVSLRRIRRAALYFGPEDGGVVRRPTEYYRCLVNLGAAQVTNAEYAKACATHDALAEFVDQYPAGTFRRLDYPLMNGVLAAYRDGRVEARDAALRQRELMSHEAVANDPYYAANALGVYQALAGACAEALATLEETDAHFSRSRDEPEPYISYLLESNRCLVRFLSGEPDRAASEWERIGEIIPQFVFPSRPIYARRHELLAAALKKGTEMTPSELDNILLVDRGEEFGPLWRDYGHGFMLPAIEMWREN